MLNIQEIDGVLHKIIEIRVDNFNTRRQAVPLTEEEFDDIQAKVHKQQDEEKTLIAGARASGKLKKKADLEKVKDKVEPVLEAKKVDILKKKAFSIS